MLETIQVISLSVYADHKRLAGRYAIELIVVDKIRGVKSEKKEIEVQIIDGCSGFLKIEAFPEPEVLYELETVREYFVTYEN